MTSVHSSLLHASHSLCWRFFTVTRNVALAALVLGFAFVAPTAALADTTINAAGSTALLPLVKDASGLYQQAHPDVKISVSGGGSGTGINQVAAKAIDIGDSDITAPTQKELTDNRVAVIGFSVVVNPAITLKSLRKKQISDIFTGKVTNWKQVGGPDQKIVVINRPRSSGTRAVFIKTVMDGTPVSDTGLTEDATGTVVSVVKQTPGAISYAAFSGTHGQNLNELEIGGIKPTEANVISGKYPFWSYEHMFTYGPAKGEIADFIKFVQTRSDLLKKNGYIEIGQMKVTETDR